ncbi:hypothetical protein [Plastoroseomonas arctica]|uniref:Lipoprotein n=1 Tax=Plastoroseomonas arctica TaxID=1509237 RepID=A0AAF1JWP6_9PROT|nr:hypothetical protein [Plastoroseomonas arctica]MBR0654902.1 hypothetical protein [Plastoroseomonas arctica]
MNRGALAKKLSFVALAGLSLSGCLGFSRPDATFPQALQAPSPRGGAAVTISGRVEAAKIALGTLERRVVISANGADVGRGTLPDARSPEAAATPIAINGDYQGTPIAARCENHEFSEPPGERRGIIHRLTFAEINCQVNYGGRPLGTLTMQHNPAGSVVNAPVVVSAR